MQLSISAWVSVLLSVSPGGSIHDSLLLFTSALSTLLPALLCRSDVLPSDPEGSDAAAAAAPDELAALAASAALVPAPTPDSFTSWIPLSSSSSHISNTVEGSIPFSTMVGLPSSRKLLSVGCPLHAALLSTCTTTAATSVSEVSLTATQLFNIYIYMQVDLDNISTSAIITIECFVDIVLVDSCPTLSMSGDISLNC